ncbi:MAG: hypothetical protein AB8G86_30095 [Saprospiraceae bacterium]
MSIQRRYICFILLLIAVSISTCGQQYLPKKTNSGGEFLQYKDYLDFTVVNELKSLAKPNLHQQGYWLWHHRIQFLLISTNKNAAFEQAARFNTNNLAARQYVNLPQRQAYYKWANLYFIDHKYPVRWMEVADQTVGNLMLALPKIISWLGYSNPEIRRFILNGNKLILDDMLPRINDFMTNTHLEKQLSKKEAFLWDAQTLADEQALIQPLYESLSKESIEILENNLKTTYGVDIDLLNISERWAFGMHLMKYLGITPVMMPEPGGCWSLLNFNTPIYEE